MNIAQRGSALPPSEPARPRGLLARLHLDLPLLTALLLLSGFGLLVLYSASGGNLGLFKRQVLHYALAFIVMVVVARIHPRTLYRWSPHLYAVTLAALALVLITGTVSKGAQRWLDLGVIRVQPSELAKLTTPMMVAWYLARQKLPPGWRALLVSLALIALPAVLIVREPDLGTAILVATSGLIVLFLAGVSWRLIVGLLITLAAAAPLAWHFLLKDYQRQRVLTFLNPENDPLGAGYHIIQSMIAIGSGGVYGKGWLNGTQSQLAFLPERHTDFIFAVIGEEFGLVGAAALLGLYAFIVLRGLYIAIQAQDSYSRLLAGAVTLVFFVYLFVNTGMVSGLLPVVGVPLPLVSYGGTSLLTLMTGFGILMSIHTHRKLLPQ